MVFRCRFALVVQYVCRASPVHFIRYLDCGNYTLVCCRVSCDITVVFCVEQAAQKELAKLRETEDKIRRAKEAQERRDREKEEKKARKKALVDITAGVYLYTNACAVDSYAMSI